jgi:hypothetical protein
MPGKRERNKESTKRAAAGAGAVAKIGATAVATTVFGPVGGVATALGAQLLEHAKGLYTERRAIRIEQFHRLLLEGVPEKDRVDVMDRLIADDDAFGHYASLLEKVAQDDEAEKVPLYASLMRHLAGRPEGASRGHELDRHVIRSLRELTASDVTTLKSLVDLNQQFRINVALVYAAGMDENPKFRDNKQRLLKHRDFLEACSPLEEAGIRRLEYAGLIRSVGVLGDQHYEVTPIGLKLWLVVEPALRLDDSPHCP